VVPRANENGKRREGWDLGQASIWAHPYELQSIHSFSL